MTINLDEGYLFGLGVFETIHVYRRCPLFLEAHLERLNRGLEILDIAKTVTVEDIRNILEASEIHSDDEVLKIVVSSENTLFQMRGYPYREEQFKEGFHLTKSAVRRDANALLPTLKSLNYGENILEKRKCMALGYDEAIFLNGSDQVAECTMSNLFIVCAGKVSTPAAECGLLKGTVRTFLMDIESVEEAHLKMDDIFGADEVFITNALLGVMPAVGIDGKPFAIGPVTKSLMEKYRQEKERQAEEVCQNIKKRL